MSGKQVWTFGVMDVRGELKNWKRNLYSAFEMCWHTRRNQISSFPKTDESI